MQIIKQPEKSEWKKLLQRPYADHSGVMFDVQKILQEVKLHGDEAIRSFAEKFGEAHVDDLVVSADEFMYAEKNLPQQLKNAIQAAYKNIEAFHKKQVSPVEIIETIPGISCWRKNIGIERVGLYIPGGTAPLFSTVLMLGIPATLAGCKEIILCTPCQKNGSVHPAILWAARLVGVTKIIKAGGAQAIAAMTYGTASVPVVDKIFGPGNQYVTAAKQAVQLQGMAIDMPAGPSEVCVLADDTANAAFIASDLLAQAEHGIDSQVVLVSCEQTLVADVLAEIEKQVVALPRKDIVRKALGHSKAFVMRNREEAIDLVNEYAAEHLIISCRNAIDVAEKIINAGSVFIGNFSPESVGDYASGTNHTLPTNGFARAYSGVSVDSFVKKVTFQQLTEEGLNHIAETVMVMAEAEGLQAHSHSVAIRLQNRS